MTSRWCSRGPKATCTAECDYTTAIPVHHNNMIWTPPLRKTLSLKVCCKWLSPSIFLMMSSTQVRPPSYRHSNFSRECQHSLTQSCCVFHQCCAVMATNFGKKISREIVAAGVVAFYKFINQVNCGCVLVFFFLSALIQKDVVSKGNVGGQRNHKIILWESQGWSTEEITKSADPIPGSHSLRLSRDVGPQSPPPGGWDAYQGP